MPSPSELLCKEVKNLSPDFDTEAFEIAVACIKAQESNGSTVWLNLNAPPSSGKTLILDSFTAEALPQVGQPSIRKGILVLDSVTPRTFISGFSGLKDSGILERIESCSLLIKDLSPLAGNNEARMIFSILRRVFDGSLSMTFGSGKTKEWQGRITIICAGVNHLSTMDAELGARLLSITLRPIKFSAQLAEQNITLKPVVANVLQQMNVPKVTTGMYNLTRPFAESLAAMRAYVQRDWRDRGVHELPVEEQAHRLNKQLAALMAGLCELRQCQPRETLDTIQRVTVESVQPYRVVALSAMAKQPNKETTFPDLIKTIRTTSDWKVTDRTIRFVLDDLDVLQIIDKDENTNFGQVVKLRQGKRWYRLNAVVNYLKNM